MKYGYIVTTILGLVFGIYLGGKLFSRTELREIPIPVTTVKTQTVTKEIIKQADGTVIERLVTQTKDRVKTSPQPKVPQYRAGILIPVASELKLPTVTASRRLFGSVWAESQFDIRHKEITLGLSYEF